MHKAIRLAVWVWCATGLGGIVQADPTTLFESDPLFVHVGLLSPDAHQQLLALLGRPAFRVIDPLGASSLLVAASAGDASMIAADSDPPPQRIPEPGMFTLLTLVAAAMLGRRHMDRRRRGILLTR